MIIVKLIKFGLYKLNLCVVIFIKTGDTFDEDAHLFLLTGGMIPQQVNGDFRFLFQGDSYDSVVTADRFLGKVTGGDKFILKILPMALSSGLAGVSKEENSSIVSW